MTFEDVGINVILLDIGASLLDRETMKSYRTNCLVEGTVCPISFVKDVLVCVWSFVTVYELTS